MEHKLRILRRYTDGGDYEDMEYTRAFIGTTKKYSSFIGNHASVLAQ
jgi:hypothetical protein